MNPDTTPPPPFLTRAEEDALADRLGVDDLDIHCALNQLTQRLVCADLDIEWPQHSLGALDEEIADRLLGRSTLMNPDRTDAMCSHPCWEKWGNVAERMIRGGWVDVRAVVADGGYPDLTP